MGRRRTTQDNSDTPDGGLTPQQLACVDVLVSGKTLTEAAAAIGVGRPAVSDWVNHFPPFQAALGARRQELWASQVETLRGLLPKALAVLGKELDGPQPLPAAIQVLKAAGFYGAVGPPTGPTTVEEAEHVQRKREQDRMMAELLL